MGRAELGTAGPCPAPDRPLNGTFAISECSLRATRLFRQRRAEWTSLGVDHSGHVSKPAFLAASPSFPSKHATTVSSAQCTEHGLAPQCCGELHGIVCSQLVVPCQSPCVCGQEPQSPGSCQNRPSPPETPARLVVLPRRPRVPPATPFPSAAATSVRVIRTVVMAIAWSILVMTSADSGSAT